MQDSPAPTAIRIIAIPTNDVAFSKIADRIFRSAGTTSPAALEERLRRTFPRAAVRARILSGDRAWYVYRDGRWSSSLSGPWWDEPGLPRLAATREGWIAEANATALGLLEIAADDLATWHFTDFIAPGALQDSMALFDIVDQGDVVGLLAVGAADDPGLELVDLAGGVVELTGHVLAVDLRARAEGDLLVGVMRLADDIEVRGSAGGDVARPDLVCHPETDAAFRGYVHLALARMPEPTPEGLALRLRRLYPHADVVVLDERWVARREPASQREESDPWWTKPDLPTVTYDGQAFIVAANDAAEALLGRSLVGHHWQEFVTPGSTEQVSAMLAILAEIGRAESRFRMPRGDGSLFEFDSYTEVVGESYTTIMRPASVAPRERVADR